MALAVDALEVEEFLSWVQLGAAELHAAYAVKWTPATLRRLKKDPEFLELLADAKELMLDSIESAVNQRALAGNRWAVEMVLYNKRPEYWRPPAQKIAIEHTTKVSHEVVLTAVGAVRELLTEEGSIAALQRRAIEAHVLDDD